MEDSSAIHSLIIAIRSAEDVAHASGKPVSEPFIRLTLLNKDLLPAATADTGVAQEESDGSSGGSKTLTFNWRVAMPYHNEPKLLLSLMEKGEEVEVGRYVLKLGDVLEKLRSPATKDQKKVIGASMPLKNKAKQKVGSLGVTLKFGNKHFLEVMSAPHTVDKKDRHRDPSEDLGREADIRPQSTSQELKKHSDTCKTLYALILEGKNLPDPERLSRMDPYVHIKCGDYEGKSRVLKNKGGNPIFNTLFIVPYTGSQLLNFKIYDNEVLREDREVGFVDVDVSEFVRRAVAPSGAVQVHPVTLSVTPTVQKNKEGGTLQAVIAFDDTYTSKVVIESEVTSLDGFLQSQRAEDSLADGRNWLKTSTFTDDGYESSSSSEVSEWTEQDTTSLVTSSQASESVRVVVVNLYQVSKLPLNDRVSVYAKLSVGEDSLSTRVSRVEQGKVTFTEPFTFTYRRHRYIYFRIFEHDSMKKDCLVAQARFDLEYFMQCRANTYDGTKKLRSSKGELPGSVMAFRVQKSVVPRGQL